VTPIHDRKTTRGEYETKRKHVALTEDRSKEGGIEKRGGHRHIVGL